MGRTDFSQCQTMWQGQLASNSTFRELYGWNGPVQNIPKNASTQISTWGCKQLCGDGIDWYDWDQASSTITTWVLPIIGVLAQAPFLSNAFWSTVFTLARWTGSPMASLAYVLWNIRVSGKAALMVDMSIPYSKRVEEPKTDFGSIRDSFYLLLTMNQYGMNPKIRTRREAEGLLRIALFSKDLRLLQTKRATEEERDASTSLFWNDPSNSQGTQSTTFPSGLDERCEAVGHLNTIRQKLALEFRRHRRQGVVPVFLSTLWFLIAMGISIQDAFGDLGGNATAHDLALGYLLGWLPILILSTVVDRNPVSADDVKEKLNKLVGRVRESLQDEAIRDDLINSIEDPAQRHKMREWLKQISDACPDMQKSFFEKFAGQGRMQWHYGVAHPILTDIESAFIKDEGRDWLNNEMDARHSLVLGEVEDGLDWFDHREFWQVAWAVLIVVGVVAGAWIISFMTPTVGLGCRSGGYTIFVAIAASLLVAEMAIWWILDAEKRRLKGLWEKIDPRRRASSGVGLVRAIPLTISQVRMMAKGKTPTTRSEDLADRHHRIQQQLKWWFFRPLEIANMLLLLWLCFAQTFGADETCDCITSTWGSGGGYMDFTQWNTANSVYVDRWWIIGTTVSSAIICLCMLYLVVEWCAQSHLSTADMKSAADGLQNTRRFRRVVYGVFGKTVQFFAYNSLVWQRQVHCRKPHHQHCVTRNKHSPVAPQLPRLVVPLPSPSPLATPVSDGQHSRTSHEFLLPPIHTITGRSRTDSDSSVSTQSGVSPGGHDAVFEDDVVDGAEGRLSMPYARRSRPRRSTDGGHRETAIELESMGIVPLDE